MRWSLLYMLSARGISAVKDLLLIYFVGHGSDLDGYFFALLWLMIPVVWFRDAYVNYFGSLLKRSVNNASEYLTNMASAVFIAHLSSLIVINIFEILFDSVSYQNFQLVKKTDIESIFRLFVYSGFISLAAQALLISMDSKNSALIIEGISSLLMVIVFLGYYIFDMKIDGLAALSLWTLTQAISSIMLYVVYICLRIRWSNDLLFGKVMGEIFYRNSYEFTRMFYVVLGAIFQTSILAIEQKISAKLGFGWVGMIAVAGKFTGLIVSYGVTVVGREAVIRFSTINDELDRSLKIRDGITYLIWTCFLRKFVYVLVLLACILFVRMVWNFETIWDDIFYVLFPLSIVAAFTVANQVFVSLMVIHGDVKYISLPSFLGLLNAILYLWLSGDSISIAEFIGYLVLNALLMMLVWGYLINTTFDLHISQSLWLICGALIRRNTMKIFGSKTIGTVDRINIDGRKMVAKRRFSSEYWVRSNDPLAGPQSYDQYLTRTQVKALSHDVALSNSEVMCFDDWSDHNIHDLLRNRLTTTENICDILAALGRSLSLAHSRMSMGIDAKKRVVQNLSPCDGRLIEINDRFPLSASLFAVINVHGDFVPANVLVRNFDGGAESIEFGIVDFDRRNYFSSSSFSKTALVDVSSFVGSICLLRGPLIFSDKLRRTEFDRFSRAFISGYCGVGLKNVDFVDLLIRAFLIDYFSKRFSFSDRISMRFVDSFYMEAV